MTVGFTVDIGGTEHLTAGFKDLRTNKFLPHKLESIGQLEFGK
jgi:oligopeptidase B